jgi:hypothetical protein
MRIELNSIFGHRGDHADTCGNRIQRYQPITLA